MEKYESILKFKKYVVNKVVFESNNEFNKEKEQNAGGLNITKNTVFDENNKSMTINLKVNVFNKPKENNYPFEIMIDVTGYFSVEEGTAEKLEKNAISIMYPYIRALVSTYTINSTDIALVLPPININKLLEEQ